MDSRVCVTLQLPSPGVADRFGADGPVGGESADFGGVIRRRRSLWRRGNAWGSGFGTGAVCLSQRRELVALQLAQYSKASSSPCSLPSSLPSPRAGPPPPRPKTVRPQSLRVPSPHIRVSSLGCRVVVVQQHVTNRIVAASSRAPSSPR